MGKSFFSGCTHVWYSAYYVLLICDFKWLFFADLKIPCSPHIRCKWFFVNSARDRLRSLLKACAHPHALHLYTHKQLESSKCIILSILFWSKHFFTTLIGHDLSLFWVWPHYSNPNNAQTNINRQPTYDLAIKHFRFEENP